MPVCGGVRRQRRKMTRTLYPAIDWFIPERLRRDPAVLERARLFVISNFSGPPLGLVVFFYLRQIDPEAGPRLWLIFAGIAGFFAYPLALRATAAFDLLTLASMEQLLLVALYGAFDYGGLGSPFLPWIIALPVILLYHFGARPLYRGLVFLVLGAHLAAFYLFYLHAPEFVERFPPQQFTAVGLLSLFCAALSVATTSLYHSSIVSAQRAELEREVGVRRLAEARLREAKEEAERANRSKSEFLAKMSHELRTPLNAIIGFSQVIGSELLGPVGMPRYAEYGGDIERSGQHLLQIISEILDLAKIETGKFVLQESAFDLVALTRETIDLVRPLAEVRAVSLGLVSGAERIRLYADPLRVRQILLNLLSNATKFSRDGGGIEVALIRERGSGVRLRVSDTGVGIAAADLERVLRPFEQVGDAMLNNGGGTGLGLPLARELAMLHGGALTLSSEVGRGTTVTVTFPEARLAQKRVEDGARRASA
jgi:signal transduction histidine kinase